MTTRLEVEFQDADRARDAVIELERRGVTDADRVELTGFADPSEESTRRRSDRQVATVAARRAGVSGTVGAVVAALLGAGVTLLLDLEPQPAVALGTAAGVGLLVGALTGYWALASRLPVTDGALEAVDPGPGRAVQVVLHLDDPDSLSAARSTLEDAGGTVRPQG